MTGRAARACQANSSPKACPPGAPCGAYRGMSRDSITRRRPDPLPGSWEIPTAAAAAWVALAAATLLAAQGSAAYLTGHGWLWPHAPDLFGALGGLLTGHIGVGTSPTDGLPPPALVYALAGVLELALAGAAHRGGGPVLDQHRTRTPARHGDPRAGRDDPRCRAAATGPATDPPRPVRPPHRDRGLPGQRAHRTRPPISRPDRPASRPGTPRSPQRDGDAPGQPRTRFSPSAVGWRLGVGQGPPHERVVGAVRPDHRRVRPAGLRQDPGPAHPRAARRAGRGAGHPDQGAGPAADRGPARRRQAVRWRCWTRSGWPPGCRSWCGTRSPAAWTR